MTRRWTITTRLTLALAALLLGYGALVAGLGRQVAAQQEQESLQRLSHGLARHIVGHWPEITVADPGQAERAARDALLQMLMVVNPGVQVYILDARGRVDAYLGEPGMVRQPQVDLDAVRGFLGGAELPLHGTDPMGSGEPRIFSAAMFPPRPGDTHPPGYLYIVLDGRARGQVAAQLSQQRVWQGAAAAAAAGLLATWALGLFSFHRLTLPLQRVARRMRDYGHHRPTDTPAPPPGDEVQAITQAFDALTARVETQARREQEQAEAHREMMASVAHDLRTPLTALHGQLEALAAGTPQPQRVLAAALAQSDKVRRLSQQLFELAALNASGQVLHRERFSLDELVADAVQKFECGASVPGVTLAGPPPGRMEFDGDLQLIERALTNLIDNAMRYAPGAQPVRVSLQHQGGQAHIVVEDGGPGLPPELQQRLQEGRSLRDPPLRRGGRWRHAPVPGLADGGLRPLSPSARPPPWARSSAPAGRPAQRGFQCRATTAQRCPPAPAR